MLHMHCMALLYILAATHLTVSMVSINVSFALTHMLDIILSPRPPWSVGTILNILYLTF